MIRLFCCIMMICSLASAVGANPIKFSSVIDSLENALRNSTDTTQVINLNRLSYQYLLSADIDRAFNYAGQAITLSKNLSYRKGFAKGMINLGNVYINRSMYDSAKNNYERALSVGREINNLIIISHATNNLGEVYRYLGNYEKALEHYLGSLRACEQLKDISGEAETLNNIGLVHEMMNDTRRAIAAYQKALAIGGDNLSPFDQSVIILNLGKAYDKIGETDKANALFKESLTIKTSINDLEGIAIVLSALGEVALKKDLRPEALLYFQKSLATAEKVGDRNRIATALNDIGVTYTSFGLYQKSIDQLKLALQIANDIGAADVKKGIYQNLSINYEHLHQTATALAYYKLYEAIKDSLINEARLRNVAVMEIGFESEKKDREINSLRDDRLALHQMNREQMILFIAALVAAAGVLILMLFRTKNLQLSTVNLQQTIETQNRELVTASALVNKKNFAFIQIQNDLRSMPQQSGREVVHQVVKEIEKEINFDQDWNNFKFHFEKVHPEFFSKIKNLAPGLSVTEQRLCAYLKANLSTKEIAALTNTTIRSVQQAKYRVNKKFEDSNGTLAEYLMSI